MRLRKFITGALICIGILASAAPSAWCQSPSVSPVYLVRDGHNEVSLYERFSLFIQHSARIRKVMDFDEEVISVQTVDGSPNQFRIYAQRAGVTSVTLVDEFGQAFSIEVLVRGDVRHLESIIRRLYPNDSIAIEQISDTAVRLDGWVSRPENITEIQAIAEQFYPQVLNHMKTGGVQQVLLKCTVLEVQRSKFRQMGMNFSLVRPDGFLTSTPGPITPISTLTSGGAGTNLTMTGFQNTSIAFGFTRPNQVFNGFIQAMQEEGLLTSHVTPMIVTHNGRPANFLSGGELPVPITAGLGATGIEFREFGIQMNAVPYILGNGRVRLEVEAIIRDQDFSNAVTIAGTTTTAFKTNSANTQVEMNFGEALVIAGLVSQRNNAAAQKLPFLGELPYIGAAFSRKSFTQSESELIILVTPEYVAPMPAGQLPSTGPGTFTDIPVDRELYFHGLLEVPKVGDACENCHGMMTGHGCPNPGCRHHHGTANPQNCTPGLSRSDSAAPPAVAPTDKGPRRVLPAGQSQVLPEKTESGQSQSRSGSTGLISPTLR